jgi:hypothetical protein
MASTNAPLRVVALEGRADTVAVATKATTALVPAFESIASAARRLGVDAEGLRRRCHQVGERVGDYAVARLDGGVVAFKFGCYWRVRFPREVPLGESPARGGA